MKPKLTLQEERRPKTTISPSDYGKLECDIILALQGLKPTNETEWNSTLRMAAGKGVEEQMLNILKKNGIVANDYTQDGDSRKGERLGTPISYRIDAITQKSVLTTDDLTLPESHTIELEDGEPIEIKSINNKNSFDIQKYIDNTPREAYVGQLAIYMDLEGKDRGHLFVSSIDGLNCFWFICKKTGEGVYQCGNTIVDLNKEYKRWADIWSRKGDKPNFHEEIYKIPVEGIDWTKLTKSKISDCRNGRFVVGSENKYKIDYSPYKDMIITEQGASLGYSDEELVKVKLATAGYSAK